MSTSSNRSRSNSGGAKKRGGKRKSGRSSKKFDSAKFWGDPEVERELPVLPIATPDPSAAVASLGHPPLPGQGAASQQYFKAVYERASMLAGALAHAGGLDGLADTNGEADSSSEDMDKAE